MDGATDEPSSPSASAGPSQAAAVPRACDACRTRKIRCNRESPCAHCLHAKIECTQSGVKPREKRTRILLTHQYEKKIDLIDRRLEDVLLLLEELKTQLPPRSSLPARPTVPTTVASSSPASHVTHVSHGTHGSYPNHADETGNVVEGESSMTAHSVFANDLLQKAVRGDSRPEMHERVEALRHMVEAMKKQPAAHEMTYPRARPTRPAAPEGCDLPPIEKTLEILKLTKSHNHLGAAWVLELFHMHNFPETCLAVYMATDYNAAHFIIVNVGLHFLFCAYSDMLPDKRDEYLGLSLVCGVNVETALSNLPLHLPANDDVIVALSLGAFYAVDLGKPSLAWILTSKASELCQSMGYHRIGTFKHESSEAAQYKQLLFWIVYTNDKSLSLRLGRSSTIQDYDVTVPDPRPEGPRQTIITAFFYLWILESKLQGQIYELLYCPDAIAQPETVRKARVQQLVHRLDELDALTGETEAKWHKFSRENSGDDLTDFFLVSDHVLRLSTRTLIQRAVPNPAGSSTTFTVECTQTARETLARHQECMAIVERGTVTLFTTYMNWTILFAPFVPFIVLFCQVIETRDREDLARLEAFVASLQPHPDVTEAVDKFRRLLQGLYNVASQYVESQSGAGRDNHQASAEVDTYLAALGFPSFQPVAGQQEAGYLPGGTGDAGDQAFQRGVNPMIWMGNGAQLEDWFYNNQQMMTFLEDGFSYEGRWGGS